MKFLEKLTRKPEMFQRIFGLKFELFSLLSKNIKPLWEEQEFQRLNRANRKRSIGAGHPYSFKTIEEKVITVLFYYKAYPTQELLGAILDVDQSVISRLFNALLPLIEEAADPELKSFLNKAKEFCNNEKIKTLDKLIEKYPELKDASTDVTEQKCYRSTNNEEQKEYYSGKSKKHAIKTQISVSYNGKILDVSNSYPGKTHDKKIMDQEKTVGKFVKFVPQRFDLGYQGIKKDYSDHYLILPWKKKKGKELSNLEKENNKANSKRRVIVENVFSRAKKFRILSGLFRNPIKSYNAVFRGVAAILNFRLKNGIVQTG